jgi:uncharacterized protein
MDRSLLILGASVRAAAQSAVRSGYQPICGDLFADADLPNAAVGQVARRFPGDLLRIAEQSPPAPWMYAGGLENYPRLVERVSRRRELLGTTADALRRVRDPFDLSQVIERGGLSFPECREESNGLPPDGSWLQKSWRSSGGLRIQPWHGETRPQRGRDCYYQRRIEGTSASAVYLAASGSARLLGITEQLLTGSDRLPFQYAGSIGPIDLPPSQYGRIVALGELLSRQFDLRGLFGIDLVIADDDVWAIEINPRYTASIEVLERALGFNAIDLHIDACRDERLPAFGLRQRRTYCGKLILYAEHRQLVTVGMVDALRQRNQGGPWPQVADIPRAGTRLSPGHPAFTVFATAGDLTALRVDLRKQRNCVREAFSI